MPNLTQDEALALLVEYRDALRQYHKGTTAAERVEIWEMTYNRGYYYINHLPGVRRTEIERRINYLTKNNADKEAPQ